MRGFRFRSSWVWPSAAKVKYSAAHEKNPLVPRVSVNIHHRLLCLFMTKNIFLITKNFNGFTISLRRWLRRMSA